MDQGFFAQAFEQFHRGGPVMWPILACSLIGLTVACERLIAFWKYTFANFYFTRKQNAILEKMRLGAFADALALAKKGDSAVCRIYASALEHLDTGFEVALEGASQREIDRLRRGFSLLDTVITASPMFGILGTVTGIINTFTALSAHGMENPTAAMAGIAEALITTAAGLIVAISCLFPFNFFIAQLRRKTHELEQTVRLFEVAYNSGRQRPKPPEPAAEPAEKKEKA